jgi:RNA polymerase sigma-70 factor (ECF subfamily)
MQVALQVKQPPEYLTLQTPGDDHKRLMEKVAQSQDRGAFKALFLYFGPRLKAMMMKSGADHATADDLVQDVMMRVWRKCELYTPARGAVSTWIFTIARNARIDRLRRASSQPYDDIDEFELVSDNPDAEQEIFANQRASLVSQAITTLPDEQQQIMKMAFISDLPQSEIAKKLSLPLGTVKSRMRLAYGKLRTKLKDLQ